MNGGMRAAANTLQKIVGGHEPRLLENPLAIEASCGARASQAAEDKHVEQQSRQWWMRATKRSSAAGGTEQAHHLRPIQRLRHVVRVEHAPVDEVAGYGAIHTHALGEQSVGGGDEAAAVPAPCVAAELPGIRVPSAAA
jgi:hypothetical protein